MNRDLLPSGFISLRYEESAVEEPARPEGYAIEEPARHEESSVEEPGLA